VDVQSLWLMLGGVRVGGSQKNFVSPLPHHLLGWGKVQQVCTVQQLIGGNVLRVAKEDDAQD
jgi:hypothetical protein